MVEHQGVEPGTGLPAYRILIRWQHLRIVYRKYGVNLCATNFPCD